jgi:S1-C subfamily serine protease
MFKHGARSALLAAVLMAGIVGSPSSAPGGLPVWAARACGGTVLIEAETRRESRAGSGFFLDSRGFVATALHTIEGARRIRVSIPGSYAASDARLLAASSTWDLAILSVSWPSEAAYPGLSLDSGPPLPPGTEVAVTGFARIDGLAPRVSLTIRGIVRGKLEHRGGYSYLLDLDARPGLSGSPVYRTDSGDVVAVLTRVQGSGAGVGPGGAAPARALAELMEGIKSNY